MPATAEPPVAAPPTPQFDAPTPGLEGGSLYAAIDKHLDPNKKAPAAQPPAPPATPPVDKTTPPAKVDKPKSEVVVTKDDPLSSLLPTDAPAAEKAKPAAKEVDFADFDKEFPDDPEHTKNDPKANERWKAVKQTAKEAKKEAARLADERADLQRQIEEIKKGTPADAPEVESMRAKIADYEKRDAVFKLEHDPKFQGEVLKPLDEAYSAVDALCETYKIDPAKLNEALSKKERTERNQALSKLIADADMNPLDQADFTKTVGVVQDLEMSRMIAYQKAQDLTKAAQGEMKQREEQQKAQRTAAFESADKEVFEILSTKAEVYKDILSDDATAVDLRKSVEKWRKTPESERDPKLVALSDYAPFLMNKAKEKIKELTKELETYKGKVTELIEGDAGAGDGGQRQQQNQPEKKLAPGEGVGMAVDAYHAGRR